MFSGEEIKLRGATWDQGALKLSGQTVSAVSVRIFTHAWNFQPLAKKKNSTVQSLYTQMVP
jgi:hypothetical protein